MVKKCENPECNNTFETNIPHKAYCQKKCARRAQRLRGHSHGCPINHIYKSYEYNANLRDYLFDITKEDVERLIKQDCHYCGAKPSATNAKWKDFEYNGIDRLDNHDGYHLGNVVSCCAKCNKMKSNLNVDDFFKHMKQILAYHLNR